MAIIAISFHSIILIAGGRDARPPAISIMEWNEIAIIVICATIALIIAIIFALALYADRLVFGRRQNRNVNLKYFSAEDFCINREKISASYKGKNLFAAVYYVTPVTDCKKVILFCHGMGAGHAAYMTEIATLAKYGYAVVAYDSIGCGQSEGKNIRGFYANVECAVAAYIAIKSNAQLKDKPVYLVGHSWGAYAALCATKYVAAEGVVALSGFNTPSRMLQDGAAGVMGDFLARLCRPFWYIINLCKFGFKGNSDAVRCIQKSGVPAFLAYGTNDTVIEAGNTPATKAKGVNIQSVIYKGKGHDVYITDQAQKLTEELLSALSPSRFASAEERKKYFAQFDFVAATREDEDVIKQITFFIDSH